jgi:hypothetical protein
MKLKPFGEIRDRRRALRSFKEALEIMQFPRSRLISRRSISIAAPAFSATVFENLERRFNGAGPLLVSPIILLRRVRSYQSSIMPQ